MGNIMYIYCTRHIDVQSLLISLYLLAKFNLCKYHYHPYYLFYHLKKICALVAPGGGDGEDLLDGQGQGRKRKGKNVITTTFISHINTNTILWKYKRKCLSLFICRVKGNH